MSESINVVQSFFVQVVYNDYLNPAAVAIERDTNSVTRVDTIRAICNTPHEVSSTHHYHYSEAWW